MRSKLQENEGTSVAHLSYTLTARRQIYPHRLVITAGTIEEVITQFQRAVPVQVQQQGIPPVVFVFSGQGSQYHGMGSSLYRSSPLFKKYITECDSILRGLGFRSMLHVITGETNNETDSFAAEVNQTAIFSLEYALAMLWLSWGIKPSAVVGHM